MSPLDHCPVRRFLVGTHASPPARTEVQGVRRRRNYAGRWDQLISSCTKGLNQLLWLSHNRLRNYIIDQTNVYPTAQKRKMKTFAGFKRRAVVICPTDDDLKLRTQKREKEEGKDVPDSAVLEMKANFKLPEVGELFDSVEYVELDKEAGEKLVAQYNKEGGANPEKGSSIASRIGGGSNFRRDNDRGSRGSYRGNRGSWDRERDRQGGYDRRDRNGSWNRNSRDLGTRLGPRDGRGGSGSGGYNRDNRGGGYNNYNSRGGGGSSYRDNRGSAGARPVYGGDSDQYKYQNTNYSAAATNWNQGAAAYGQSYGYGAGYGMQGYGATTPQSYSQSYNWPQNQYGQQQTYYQQGYRADATAAAAAPSASAASGYYGHQVGSWGTTPAATPAAQPAQNAWGTPGYSQAQQTWGAQSYGGYGGYKK